MINLVTALALMGAVVLCAGCALCAVIMYVDEVRKYEKR